MSLNHFQGPVLSKNYMGFATKPFEVCGPRRARRRRDTTSMLMAAGVAIAAVIGVSLGLREAGGATEPAGLQVAMPPAFSTELEPRLSEDVIQAAQSPPLPVDAVDSLGALASAPVLPAPDAEMSDHQLRRDHSKAARKRQRAELTKAQARASERTGAMQKSSHGPRRQARPAGWPYIQ
jgi:hypothetical protein